MKHLGCRTSCIDLTFHVLSSYNICHADGQPYRLEKQYSVDFKQQSPIGYQLEQQDTVSTSSIAVRYINYLAPWFDVLQPVITLSGRVVKRRSTDGGFNDLSVSCSSMNGILA